LLVGPLLYHMFLIDMRISFASPTRSIPRLSGGR
jgi:hypothetical protein